MTIARLLICDWDANGMRRDTYLEPQGGGEHTFLCIGGGNRHYVVSGSIDGKRFPTLANRAGDAASTIDLVVGGQLADYPATYVVDLASALAAAKSFFDSGTFTDTLDWIEV